MDQAFSVAVLVGSLRKGSFNLKLAKALVALAPDNLACEFVQIGDLPLYDPDLEGDAVPSSWTRFRESIAKTSAVLFVTPEYNRSIPGGLKNALDVGSRPMGKSVWDGKPAAVATGSPGGIGGFGANHILRQSLVFLNVPAMQQPEAYIGGIADLFDADGNIAKPDTKTFLSKFMTAFGAWVALHAKQ
ncbi:ACP phosphodiesterase [Labrys okinawensis]|uniref:ACP phosphodiesterase n=1 Tax=Labrys okinawensis TaxID=346911 RepID=A0A2S9Q3T8_9HYPH|nr:NADPH-dependent FMN reductase [Labrys okinawensis]PRH84028.1 ACP phosphodiesterase [Labrys okinawensis]